MQAVFFRAVLVLCFFPLSIFAADEGKPPVRQDTQAPCVRELIGKPIRSFSVGSLNVENTFDAIIDISHSDRQFSPEASRVLPFGARGRKTGNYDWTEQKLEVKIKQIARMVKAMGSPDLMAMVEVESEVVASRIQSAIGYDGFIMTNSPDDRGVDVALFYRASPNFQLKFRKHVRLTGEYYDAHASRDILGAGFLINQRNIFWLYVNHWPSQMGPAGARFRAAQQLMDEAELRTIESRKILKESGYNPNIGIMAVGDFNVIDTDDPHPFDEALLEKGGKVRFADVGAEFRKSPDVPQAKKDAMPRGTYYYIDSSKKKADSKEKSSTGSWNDLDRVFSNAALLDGKNLMQVDVGSYRIIHPSFSSMKHVEDDGTVVHIPRPYNFDATEATVETGVTDHFGVVVDINVAP